MATPEGLKALRDDIASTESMIDQAQAHCDQHRHLWSEDQVWEVQASIDIKRYQLTIAKMQVKMLEDMANL